MTQDLLGERPETQAPAPRAARVKQPPAPPKVYTPVTEIEKRAIKAICTTRVRYPPATATKRFARDIQGATELTDAQRRYLWKIVYRFRRQIPNAIVDDAVRAGGHQ